MESIFTTLHYGKEQTWGTTATCTYQKLRFTGESFARKLKRAISTEIKKDRQVADIITIDADVDGGFNFELSYESFEDLLEGALWDAWSDEVSISAKGIGISTSGTITAATGATFGSANFYSLEAGNFIKLDGSSDDDNNGYYQILTKPSNSLITVTPTPNSTVASGSDTITLNGTYLRNGVNKYSYTFVREHGKPFGDKQFFTFTGCVSDTFALNIDVASVLKGNFGFLGKDVFLTQALSAVSASNETTSTKIVNTTGNIAELKEDNAESSGCFINSLNVTINNNARGRKVIGSLGNCGIGIGMCNVAGTISAFFRNSDLYDKYLNGTETSLSFQVVDNVNNVYLVDIPRIKLASNKINIGGVDQSVMQNIDFQGLIDNDFGYTIQISRFSGDGPGPPSVVYLTEISLTGPSSVNTDTLSTVFTLTSQYGPGSAGNVTEDTIFSLASDSSGTAVFYSDSGGANVITELTISNGTSTATFYYTDSVGGTPTITATRTSGMSLGADTLQITIKPGVATRSLLHFDGSNGSSVFEDETSKAWAATADAKLDTSLKVFGTASGAFDGTGDYVSTTDMTGMHFGAGAFTIDFRIRLGTPQPLYHDLFQIGGLLTDNFIAFEFLPGFLPAGSLGYTMNGNGSPISSGGNTAFGMYNDTWYHFALVREALGDIKLYRNGVLKMTVSSAQVAAYTFDFTEGIWIGHAPVYNDGKLLGNIDEFRISNIARWTEDFTPPLEEYVI